MAYAVWIFPVAFFIAQNCYFGWNAKPKSDAELMADGLTIAMMMAAYLASRG